MNWWLADTYADVPQVVDLASQGLGCAASGAKLASASPSEPVAPLAAAPAAATAAAAAPAVTSAATKPTATGVYVPSTLEQAWTLGVSRWRHGHEAAYVPAGTAARRSSW